MGRIKLCPFWRREKWRKVWFKNLPKCLRRMRTTSVIRLGCFWKVLSRNFLTKSRPNIWLLNRLFWWSDFLCQKFTVVTSWATVGKNLATFYFKIWSHWCWWRWRKRLIQVVNVNKLFWRKSPKIKKLAKVCRNVWTGTKIENNAIYKQNYYI